MCIFRPCANPTQVGVWWRDDTKWRRYDAAHEKLIRKSVSQNLKSIDLGSIVSTVHPKGWHYTADLKKMVQVAVTTSQKREIMIIDRPDASVPLLPGGLQVADGPPQENVAPAVHYRDSSGTLQQYPQSVAMAVLEAVVGGKQTSLVHQDQENSKYLLFDFPMMKQHVVLYMNGEDDDEPVLTDEDPVDVIIEVPRSPPVMAAIAEKCGKELRRKIVEMLIDRYPSDEHVDAVLPANCKLPKARMIESKHKKGNGTHMPGPSSYEMFADRLEEALEQSRSTKVNAFELLMHVTSTLPLGDGEESNLNLRCKLVQSHDADGVNGKVQRSKVMAT